MIKASGKGEGLTGDGKTTRLYGNDLVLASSPPEMPNKEEER